ncbi:MAG: hypothetical protein KIT68_05710 [Phycisphaeraceae bacterium]|nr:hypothetical protein [Phycisphaeraceae bacterium]
MGRMLTAAIIGAIIVFAWGAVSWTVLGWQKWVMTGTDDPALVDAMKKTFKGNGVYVFPGPAMWKDPPATDAEKKAFGERLEAGPIGRIFYRQAGAKEFEPQVLLKGLLLSFAAALIAAVMLNMGARAGSSYISRVMIVVLMGMFSVLTTTFIEWNYWRLEDSYAMLMAADLLVGWIAAALVMAGMLSPRQAA